MPPLANVIERLSSQGRLDQTLILNALDEFHLLRNRARLLGDLRQLAIQFGKAGKYGRLRAVLLVACAAAGEEGFRKVESSGVLLAPRETTKKFGQFLERLRQDCHGEPQWSFFLDRLTTYSTYLHLVTATEPAVQLIREESRRAIRFWTKRLLALVELSFLGAYFDCAPVAKLSANLARFDSPESCASAVSTVIAIANSVRELDTADLGFPAIGNLEDPILGDLLAAGHLLDMMNDFARWISAFGYSLELQKSASGPVFVLSPPSPEFERSVQLGYPMYLRGDYDTAVFQAFKEVEISVRNAARLRNDRVGCPLMRDAFNPKGGPLSDAQEVPGEQIALMELFAGAIGYFKNPGSDREVELTAIEAAEAIMLASRLLRIVDSRTPQ